MLKVRMFLFGLSCILFATLSGCTTINMNVETLNNPYLPTKQYHSFTLLKSNSAAQQNESRLNSIIKNEIEKKGLVFDDKSPQLLIAIHSTEKSDNLQNVKDEKISEKLTKNLTIVLIDNIYKKQTNENKLVWQGSASATGTVSDFSSTDIEKCLIIGILQDYPNKHIATNKGINSFWCRK